MKAQRLPNGNLLVPARAAEDGVTGDGMVEVTPDMPEYQQWERFVREKSPRDMPSNPSIKVPVRL
jgi:hypothetical protein